MTSYKGSRGPALARLGRASACAGIAFACVCGCSSPRPASGPASHVLVVINEDSETSKTVGEYYAKCRAVPASNVLRLRAALSEETSQTEFESDILAPIRAATNTCPNRIDYVVLTKGIPIRIREGGYSVDGKIAAMDLPARDVGHGVRLTPNPFFLQNAPFDSSRYGMLLVTRLDGYDAADCERLVDDSLKAGSETGPFFFDPAKNRTGGAYGLLQEEMFDAAGSLRGKGLKIEIGKAGAFSAPDEPLAGYCSWGSNDSSFNRDVYGRLRFKPGALAETFVSTDGRTFSDRYSRGQSLVADLIAQGVTGVKGYVSEPYIFALAHPQVLWDRYTSGYDLAESFYMASAVLGWKDVVIGDPLCRPYKSLSH